MLRILIWSIYPSFIGSLSLKERDVLRTLFIEISGDITQHFVRLNFGRDDFRATWPV